MPCIARNSQVDERLRELVCRRPDTNLEHSSAEHVFSTIPSGQDARKKQEAVTGECVCGNQPMQVDTANIKLLLNAGQGRLTPVMYTLSKS